MKLTSKYVGRLRVDKILEHVSEEDIFRYYIPTFKKLGEPFSSQLREDPTPSCSISDKYGWLLYKDFGNGEKYNCFTYVQALYDITFKDALKTVVSDFNLFLNSSPNKPLNIVKTKEKGQKRETIIQIKARQWNEDDIYWNEYKIHKKLYKRRIKPLEHYWINGRMVYTYNKLDPAYSYECDPPGKRKILRPYCLDKRRKWSSNLIENKIYGFEYLDYEQDTCLITSSLKDVLIWETLGVNALWPQSESNLLREEDIKLLKFKNIILNFNNDKVGKKYSALNAEKYGFKEFFISEEYEEKDPSDFVKKYSLNKLLKIYETWSLNQNSSFTGTTIKNH